MAADHARRLDPTLAAKYHRLVACWRAGQPCLLRDLDGQPVTHARARQIIAEHYTVPADIRAPADAPPPPRTDRGRAGEARSRNTLHQPARPHPRLRPPAQLDTD